MPVGNHSLDQRFNIEECLPNGRGAERREETGLALGPALTLM